MLMQSNRVSRKNSLILFGLMLQFPLLVLVSLIAWQYRLLASSDLAGVTALLVAT